MNSKKLHVVNLLPTYNEAENIIPMLEALQEIANQNPQYRFSTLIVDDNSPDGTGELVKQYQNHQKPHLTSLLIKGRKSPLFAKEGARGSSKTNVHLLTGQKQGLGKALIRGYQHAIKHLHADVIVSNDCDFQFNPDDIPRLLEKINQGFAVVIASRHTSGGGVEGWETKRQITHWIANYFFAAVVAGLNQVTDHNGNFRAMRVKGVLDQIKLDQIPVTGYGFLNYMIYEFSKINTKITEIPVTFKWRERGETKVSFTPKYIRTFFRDTLEYIKLCFWIRWVRSQNKISKIKNQIYKSNI